MKRSKLLHERLRAEPFNFSRLRPSPNTLTSGLSMHCTPRAYIRYTSAHLHKSRHPWPLAMGRAIDNRRCSDLKINAETDLVCSIPGAYSRSEGGWESQWLEYKALSDWKASENSLPQSQLQQIKHSLARALHMVMKLENSKKLGYYVKADKAHHIDVDERGANRRPTFRSGPSDI